MGYQKSVILKNHTEVFIRAISLADAQARHHFFVELSLAQIGMVHTIDEIDYHVAETQEKLLDFLKNRRGLWLIAETHGQRIVGEVDILVKKLHRVRHNGHLTIGVLSEFQGIGLGSALMEEAIAWAKTKGLLRLDLDVFASNATAIHLYKKFGFIVEGVRKNFIRQPDGSFEDSLVMAKHMH